MSPLKKSVMSSTKSAPWQEVKSNCRAGQVSAGSAAGAPPGPSAASPHGPPPGGPPRSSSPPRLSPAGDLSLEPPTPSPCPQAPRLTLVWKLKTVTERQTRAVMPRHSSTDVVL